MDVCRHWTLGGQEGHLHMEFIVSSIPIEGVPNIIVGWSEHWTKKGGIQEYHQVWATPISYQDSSTPMSRCVRVDYTKDRSWE